ncbi:DUF305 domain-containing protein [Streptomyces abikoensis]|uniref:DUF305 domain-containing protein n=1 Tax=Streptomyces abikoensis TaxID=97398 RepID=UPI00368FC149
MSRSSLSRRAASAVVVTLAASLLTACGGGGGEGGGASSGPATATVSASSSGSAPSGQHNQADVHFAQEMIPHHRQAIDMADLAAKQAASDDVKALAEKIKKSQGPEIETMTAWLKSWGKPVPQGETGTQRGGPTAQPGMAGGQEMDNLRNASGTGFDKMFLTMMIAHHQGAIAMANSEKKDGLYGPAKQLADSIITSQNAEIAQMRKMLGGGSGSGTGSPSATAH